MSASLAKIWARRIHAGTHTISEVEAKYGPEGVEQVSQAYYNLFGETLV